ncbi:H-2 class II histocompatibility antigen gamma chain-like [Xyrauchen texanus]|uniref:H-2 class II histocompatibility antigen gamma chain-like n=1 Tax=Xyrauchen texanus TaxID=154827 RepID=UPI0022419B48|nr:H-2 class II histocompatibility antigen gamma chain-like [Xyrauchen texanus]
MPESNEAPLIRAPSEQTSINMGSPRGGSNSQALKVAGVTLLAGILIAGQAFTAYMAFNQKEQLNTLERRTDRLQEISRKSMAMRAPVKMHLPMSSLPLMLEDLPKDEKKDSSPKPEPSVRTQCQLEAAGEVKSLLPSFRPQCDDKGDYLAQQCWDGSEMCWCVDKNGTEIPESLTKGPVECGSTGPANPMPMEPLLVAEEKQ